MAKKIYPGNWVAQLSTYQNEPVVSIPGRLYYQPVGFAMIDGTGGTSFEVTIPSPDLRPGDKPLPNIMGMKLPAGAKVYHLGLRVSDMRKDRGKGEPLSGLVGTPTDRLKLADAIAEDDTITVDHLATKSSDVVVDGNGTILPVGTVKGVTTAQELTSDLTLRVYVTDSSGAATGDPIKSTLIGGTPIIVEACYWLEDEAPTQDNTFVPYVTVAGNG